MWIDRAWNTHVSRRSGRPGESVTDEYETARHGRRKKSVYPQAGGPSESFAAVLTLVPFTPFLVVFARFRWRVGVPASGVGADRAEDALGALGGRGKYETVGGGAEHVK